jgi:Fe-S cluster biogenesis protein NfuA
MNNERKLVKSLGQSILGGVPMDKENEIKKVIEEKINPQLALHGGACEFVKVSEEGVVTVRLSGGCAGCPSRNMTLLGGITPVLKEYVHEVTKVVLG